MSAQQSIATSKCPHPEVVGKRWGDTINPEWQDELKKLADKQKEWVAQPEATRGHGVFRGVKLSGADVFWLAERVRGKKERYVGICTLKVPTLLRPIWKELNFGEHGWQGPTFPTHTLKALTSLLRDYREPPSI